MLTLAVQYAAFVFAAACGVIQVAAAHAGLGGLQVLQGRRAAVLMGYALIGGAFFWFFGLVDRNVRGLEGMEQTLLFVPSSVCAIAVSFVVSSIAHRARLQRRLQPRRDRPHLRAPIGLEALRERSYLDALLAQREKVTR